MWVDGGGGAAPTRCWGCGGGIKEWWGDRCAGLMVVMMTHSVTTCELLLEGAWPQVSGSPPWGAGRLSHPLDPPTIPTFRGTLRAQRNISLMLFSWKYLDFFGINFSLFNIKAAASVATPPASMPLPPQLQQVFIVIKLCVFSLTG